MAMSKAQKEAADAEAAKIAAAEVNEEAAPELETAKPVSVKIRALFNRMRNPHTGAVFLVNKLTDVNDLSSKDNSWTRSQLKAKVLEIVELPKVEEEESEGE